MISLMMLMVFLVKFKLIYHIHLMFTIYSAVPSLVHVIFEY